VRQTLRAFAVAICVGALLCAIGFVMIEVASSFGLPGGLHATPVDQTDNFLRWIYYGSSTHVPLIKVAHAEHDSTFTGSASGWYHFTMDPGKVEDFKHTAVSRFVETHRFVVKDATIPSCVRISKDGPYPSWWSPEQLPDLDAVMIGPYPYLVFYFSKQTGNVYYFYEGH
jgi:hypothetical protein